MSEDIDRVVRAMTRYMEGSMSRAGMAPRWYIHDTFDETLPIVGTFSDRTERDAALKTMNARAILDASEISLRSQVERYHSALERLRYDAVNILARKPVRCFDETLAEVDAALTPPSSTGSKI